MKGKFETTFKHTQILNLSGNVFKVSFYVNVVQGTGFRYCSRVGGGAIDGWDIRSHPKNIILRIPSKRQRSIDCFIYLEHFKLS